MKDIQTVYGSVSVSGSTIPLEKRDERSCDYDPFAHRNVAHPTTDSEALIHLIKGSFGSGILSMPFAFANGGLWFGLCATLIVGSICTYCVHILVKCSHILCRRIQVPSLTFANIAETAFLAGPPSVHKWSRCARVLIDTFVVILSLGALCVYNSFVATNVKQVIEQYFHSSMDWNLRWFILMLLPVLLAVNVFIRNLKYLAPCSAIANLLMTAGVIISIYYTLISEETYKFEPPPWRERPAFVEFYKLPMFFGTVIFAIEGIGVVMPLENSMKNPQHFLGCPGVLNFGMGFIAIFYAIVGFLGYAKYGDSAAASISLNLPVKDVLAQCVKLSIAIAVFFTYALHFYVGMEIIWRNARSQFSESKKLLAEYTIRVVLVIGTVAVSILIPNVGPFISLIGAVSLSTLGLIFPPIIEIVTYYVHPGYGKFRWILWKNILLIVFGITGFVTGTLINAIGIFHQLYCNEHVHHVRKIASYGDITCEWQTAQMILSKAFSYFMMLRQLKP